MSGWSTADIPDQSGRTAIVTGANSGLGFATARHLALHGAHVVLAVRSEDKGRRAVAKIRAEAPKADVEVRLVDLADLDSVRAFAAAYEDGLDLLVDNAGIMCPPRRLSPQGHESQFAANHLGHFALTGLLLDRLRSGSDPRVVVVSSLAHGRGRIRFEDLTGAQQYSPYKFYAQSKLANLLFAAELDRRLRAAGSPVRSLAAHPGLASTDLVQSYPGPLPLVGRLVMPLICQPAELGALPQLYAATDPRAEGGQYIGPDGRNERKGRPVVVSPARPGRDLDAARRLWDLSEELTGVRYAF
jgi:NAD(P)-dependent dehydrogenase (short-subunit alcohol dehydrogenase family)